MATAAPSASPPASSPAAGVLWWGLAVVGSVAVAVLTLRSVQLAAAVALVAATVGVYAGSRRFGLLTLWLLWLVLPGLRRVLALAEGYENADPLALAPFLATATIGGIELLRARLDRRARWIIALALVGFAFGAPAGLLADPLPAVFALLAYTAGVLGFAIGYREPPARPLTIAVALTVAAAPIAIYGVLQSVAPLTPWDALWLGTVDLQSVGSKDDGTLRVFSTLNSPGTLAAILALAVTCLLTGRRFGIAQIAVVLATLAGLGLTLVRSAWGGLAAVLVLLVVISPVRLTRRVLLVGLLAAAAVPLLAARTPDLLRVQQRAQTFTQLSSDRSAADRLATPSQLVPAAISQPLGFGLGQAGEASRLSAAGGVLRATDNAPLSVVLQSGAVGLVLVFGALVLGVVSAVRNVRRRRSPSSQLVLGCLAFLVVVAFFGDVFYGVTGPVIWYLVGVAARGDQLTRSASVSS